MVVLARIRWLLALWIAIAVGAPIPIGDDGLRADTRSDGAAAAPSKPVRIAPAPGPLRVSPSNPRYFTDGHGRTVYLTGSHTWANVQDLGESDPPPVFDFDGYLKFLVRHNHNFTRLWVWEQARWRPSAPRDFHVRPLAYARTGPGIARDGRPRFDLTRFNPEYFERLRARVIAAGERGIYVSVMLFQGWSIETKKGPGNPWPGHPYHKDNNVNGIDGDLNGDGEGHEVHTLRSRPVVALQEAYVRKVVDTLNDLDNVLWEISNESHPESSEWQAHMIELIRRYEATKPKSHPVGMTAQMFGTNAPLFAGPATWISPLTEGTYKFRPPPATGEKVIITDTDHLWGSGGNRVWVWKSFARGLHPIYMEDLGADTERAQKADARAAMGDTLVYASRMNLAAMTPRGDLASSTYCLADPGVEYLVYLPIEAHRLASSRLFGSLRPLTTKWSRWFRGSFRQSVTVDLAGAPGPFTVEWFDPAAHEVAARETVGGGGRRSFTAPFYGDAVLYIVARR